MKIQDFEAIKTLMDKLQKSEHLLTVTADDINERNISGKDLTQSEKERLADLIKIFAKERIIATKQELTSYGVYDYINDTDDNDTDTIKQKFKKGDIVNVCGFSGECIITEFVNDSYSVQKIIDDCSFKYIQEQNISLANKIQNCIYNIGDVMYYEDTGYCIDKFVKNEKTNKYMASCISLTKNNIYIDINDLHKYKKKLPKT